MNTKPTLPTLAGDSNSTLGNFTWDQVLALWESLPSAKCWSAMTWFNELQEYPALVVIGGDDGETFEVVNVFERRVLNDEEFSTDRLIRCHAVNRIQIKEK